MNEIDEIKRRMLKRRGQKRLTDYHFLKLYNGMIKMMVALMVTIASLAYIKISPNGEYIKDYIFNDLNLQYVTTWVQNHLLSHKNTHIKPVSTKVDYTHIQDNFYKNNSNEVLSFASGRVIYVGKQEVLGQYITVLLENNIEVTYGNMTDVFVSLYDQVEQSTILGTYQDQVMIIFTQDEKELDYATFEEYLS